MSLLSLTVSLLLYAQKTLGEESENLDRLLDRKFYKPEPRWYAYAFRSFDRMENPTFRSYKYGFPPGIYGSSLIPINLWYQLVCLHNVKDLFMQPHNVRLVNIDYNGMLKTCDEATEPRCSWHFFVALYQPTSYNRELLKFLFKDIDLYENAGCYPVPVVAGSCSPFTSIEQMSLIYIYEVCHLYNHKDHPLLNLPALCPDPCARRPCKTIDNAIPGSCKQYGYHMYDFTCKCEQGFEWENSTQLCAIDDNCGKICHEANTISCIVNRTSATAICRCKDGFMGFDCSQKYDACVLGKAPDARGLNVGPIVPSGYDACGTTLDAGNLCFSVANTTSYTCVCSPAYVRDITLPYDNCLKPLDSCDKRICVHGQCVTSPVRRCAEGRGCVQEVAVEEETWLQFMDWTNYVMMITLGYIGALAVLLTLIGLFQRHKASERPQAETGSRKSNPLARSNTRYSGKRTEVFPTFTD
ncbi:unnamed protein product [Dicrocoelium dendriticum]|nr:unnamed protein product [Dicrocoelium dendriticum]